MENQDVLKGRSVSLTLLLVALVALFGALSLNTASAQAAFTYTVDEDGANDEPGQKDLTLHGVDATNLPTSLAVTWNWDSTGFSGANTGDACAMFDNDDNGFIDFAVCVTIEDDPAVQAAMSPRVFTCGDDKVDRCTTPIFQIPSPTSVCTVAITATQPFAAGESTPNDTTATCTIQMSDVGGTTARLVNTCSFPSANPNSDPSDCVLIIRDGFLRIVKNASPNDAGAQFNFFLDGAATPVFTSNGSGTSSIIPIDTTANPHALTETAPAGWTLSSATCSDGSAINSINVAQDETVTCTFNNVRQTGKLEVKKSLSPTNDPGLFNLQIDGTTDGDATDVGDGGSTGEETLNTGDHTVGEIAGTNTDLDDYQKSIECKADNGTGSVVANTTSDDAGPLTVPVTTDSDIVCVVTNTRETGKLEVRKDLEPNSDGGLFNLQIDGSTDGDATNVGHGGSTGEETLNTGDHTVGEIAGTSTDLDDYQKSIECKDDNGTGSVVANTTSDDAGPLTVPVTTDSDIVCLITNTRETGKLEVQKDLEPNSDGGLFNLQIDGSTDGDATNVGDGGSTGEETLNTGDHTVGETAGTDTDLDDYQKSIVCKGDNGTGDTVASTTGDDAGPLTVPVTTDSDIVCVITNTRETGKLEVQKDLSPTTDGGLFNLQIDGTTDGDATNVGDGGSTGEETLNTGDHTVGELAGTSTNLDDYQKSIECRDDNGSGSVVANTTSDDAGPLTVPVTTDSDIVCVITNTRETGKLEVQKDLSPSTDGGLFNLQIDGSTDGDATNVGDGGSTGEETLNTGDHTVGETAGTDTDLDDYQKSIQCRDQDGTGNVVAETPVGDDAGPLTVPVTTNSDIVCVITNTRETGKLEVTKDLSPNSDGGLFNLQIDGTTDGDATDVGDSGSTGEETLNTGDHTVGETAGTDTDLADYQKSIECKDDNGTGSVVASVAADNASLQVNVTTDSDIVCLITNTRETGKLEVQKVLSPSTDSGLFNLQIDASTDGDATNVGDGGSTGEETLNTGNHTVGELAGTSTNLDDYQKSIECRDANGTGSVVANTTTDDAGPLTVPVTTDSDIVCVITNTRETGKLEVQKSLEPSTDTGRFNLEIDGSSPNIGSQNVGDGGSTGEETLDTGDHTVGESAVIGTDLADYAKSIECRDDNGSGSVVANTTSDDAGPLTVPVTTDSDIVCLITNTRETGKLEVQKVLSPNTDGGLFNLQIDASTDGDATNVGDGGSTGEETLNTGDHTVGETAGTNTDLADYQKSIVCKDGNGTGSVVANTTTDDAGPLTVPVTTDSDIVCVITNTRETGKLEVTKDLSPTTDGGLFNLQIDGTTDGDATDVGDGGSTGEETLNTGNHTVGELAGTSTNLDDYQKSIVCKEDNGTGDTVANTTTDDAGPLTVPVTTDSDIVCVITNTRETGKLEVQKDLSPTTDGGLFNLQIDGTTDGDATDVGDGGSTGEETLNTGNHTVGELAGTSTNLDDYQKSIECRDANGTGSVVANTTTDDAGPLTVPVTTDSDIVCVITNTRETGKLEVQKSLEPSTDTGRFNLEIDGSSPNIGSQNVGDGGSTGEETLDTGDHTVGESAVIGTDLADYAKSIECRDDNGSGSVVANTTSDDAGPLTVPVTTSSDIVCVITNTRETGKLEVRKDLEPNSDGGLFNLQIDGTTDGDATDVGDGGSTGEETLNTGDHTVGETAGTDTDLDDYQKSIQCRDQDGTGNVVAETPVGDDAGPLTVPVTTDSDIVCVITNTRETGKLEVTKDLSPNSDGGLFNLQIDGTTDGDATDVGDGGSTGEETLNTGDHTVGETAGTDTDLDDYAKSIVCKGDNGTGDTVASTTGDDAGPLTVPVTTDSDIVCVITNTRETGKLEVQKVLSPSTDGGLFNLQIDGTTDGDATDVGDGGSTGEETLNTGDHTVGETGGTDTDLDDYAKSIVCKDDNGTGAVVANTTGDDAGPLTVPVTTDSDIVCVVTNTRETGKLEVRKDLEPNSDGGLFNLQIDGTTDGDATDVGDGGSTGEETLNTGNHTVGETAGTNTDLDDYQKSIECRDDNGTGSVVTSVGPDNASLQVNITSGSDIVCVITNTRETGKLEVRKDLEPNTDPGKFNLKIDYITDPDAVNVGDGGSTGEQVLNTGDHTVGEAAGTGTTLANYKKSIVCKGDNGTGTVVASSYGVAAPLTVPVTDGSDIVCTITNTRRTGRLEVVKKVNPTNDPGRFDLRIDGAVEKDEAAHNGTTGEKTLNTGNHSVSETVDGETTLTDYSSSIECKTNNGTGAVVAQGSGSGPLTVNVTNSADIVCTITNTRKTGKLEVVKHVNPTNDPGRFDLRIDHTVQKDEAAHNGSTGEMTLNTGDHTVSETADGETALTDYSSSIECKASNGAGAVVAQGSGSGPVTVPVTDGSDIVCTITNQRKPEIKVVKDLVPNTDPGRFDLKIDSTTFTNGGNGYADGDTDFQQVTAGSHTVSEVGHGTTNLGDYVSKVVCDSAKGTTDPGTSRSFTVAYGDKVTCTITNQRKSRLTVTKACPNGKQSPEDRFQVVLNGTPKDVLDCGQSVTYVLSFGTTVSVSEQVPAGNTTTNLANYSTTYSANCGNPTATAPVGPGTHLMCTITNTRRTRSQPFTPGYWKNHPSPRSRLLPVLLGNYSVNGGTRANAVFNAMNCGSSTTQGAIGCLAGHLLASKLNVKNGADNCINTIIGKADAFLKGQTVDGVPGLTVNTPYIGPSGTYTLTDAQRAFAIQLKNALDKYNNRGGC